MLTKAELPDCPVAMTVQLIGNKWKLLILRNLMARPWRFNEMLRSISGISQKVLTDNLRALEKDGIISRTVFPEVPPRVEYALSELGDSMRPIIDAMQAWGVKLSEDGEGNKMTQQERRRWLIEALLAEMPQYRSEVFPLTADRQWQLLRSLMNVRPPWPATEEFLKMQDDFLQEMTSEKGIVDAETLPASQRDEHLVLWQGDITTLRCDAIVNAANSALLGCFSPCHGCIDNIIHTMAGVQSLR